jgi:drug/metabolite transporter (DMT)-like permease
MWGSAFLFTKLAVATLPPVTVVAGRLGIAAVVLVVLVFAWRRRLPACGRLWGFFIAMAVIGNCLPFFLISWGQQHIDSALAGILMAIMPLATLALAHFLVPGERMNRRKVMGFLLGFLGIIVLMGPAALRELPGSGNALVAQLAVLGGALCYAVNTIIAKQRPESDALVAAAGVMVIGSLIMLPTAAATTAPSLLAPSFSALLAVTVLGLVCTALATVIYFTLITSAGPTFLSLINYLIPLWAVAVGTIFLGERPHWNALLALGLILGGIALTQRANRRIS